MAAALEMRQFMRLFTLADAEAGITPIRQKVADGTIKLYMPAQLQFRMREAVFVNGNKTLEWGAWTDVGYVREEPPKADAP